jgi:type III secretory pathway component EscR
MTGQKRQDIGEILSVISFGFEGWAKRTTYRIRLEKQTEDENVWIFSALYSEETRKFEILDVQVMREDTNADVYTVTVNDKRRSFAVGNLIYVEFIQKEVVP